MTKTYKILLIAGARPNFMKIAPIIRKIKEERLKNKELSYKLVHTGQHYDYEMSQAFFDDLEIPKPDYFLEAGSGSHAEQTAKIMVAFEKVCAEHRPDLVVVVGDVNSTLACSVVAKKMGIEVAHVEAGLRSFDLSMPEEINRMVTDAISDYFFVTEKSGVDNLKREGKPEGRIFFVGHVMIDTLLFQLGKLDKVQGSRSKVQGKGVRSEVDPDEIEKKKAFHGARVHPVEFARGGSKLKAQSLKLKAQRREEKEQYAVVTLHRPANVDDRETFSGIMEALIKISEDMPIIFPVHPRTRKIIEQFGLLESLNDARITLATPLAYMDFLRIWKDASLVLTDSGGLQEETTALGIPCFTIRENTERPVTIEEGTNTLVGTTKQGILSAYNDFRNGTTKKGRIPELWDGKAAERIVGVLVDRVRREE